MLAAAGLLTGLLLLLVLVLFGPRVKIDTTIQPKELPEDLDAYLQASEEAFDDLVPGAEKSIVWAGRPGERTPLSIIYLHGFSACRQEMAPMPERVAQALGANLFYGRFTGHGRSSEAMAACSVNRWLNDADEALEIGLRLGEKVVVIGNSTGATIATWLATRPKADRIAAAILLSPNYGLADARSRFLTLPWGRQLAQLVLGPVHGWPAHNDAYHRYWTHRFPTHALLPMLAVVRLTLSCPLETIDRPVLIVHSPHDKIINLAMIAKTFQRIGSRHKRLIGDMATSAPGGHILAGEILSPDTVEQLTTIIVDFIHNTAQLQEVKTYVA